MKNAYYIWIIFASHIFGFMCSGELFCVVFLYKGWWKDNGKQNIRSSLRVYNGTITVRKRSCGKVMFLHPLGRHPPGRHHPGRSPLPHPTPTRWPLQRPVRILLECILVRYLNCCYTTVTYSVWGRQQRETQKRWEFVRDGDIYVKKLLLLLLW